MLSERLNRSLRPAEARQTMHYICLEPLEIPLEHQNIIRGELTLRTHQALLIGYRASSHAEEQDPCQYACVYS